MLGSECGDISAVDEQPGPAFTGVADCPIAIAVGSATRSSYSGVRCHGSVWPAYQSRNRPAARGTITTAPRRLRLPALVGCGAIRAPYGLRDGLGASGLQPGGSEFPLIEKS